MKKLLALCIVAALFSAAMTVSGGVLPDGLASCQQGAAVILSDPGDYDWWYGCSPTSAGMIMGHYDVCGYGGGSYSNLVPGGAAENNTYGVGPYIANDAIASSGHISDFYSGGYGASGDDVNPPFHSFNCLADFMGTSQDSCSNSNGGTTFYYWTDGAPFTTADAVSTGTWNSDGMYGIGEYLQYRGYDYTSLYTQLIYSSSAPLGFTFAQYMAEIDAGRPVIIQVEGHSMYGYGYDAVNSSVLLHDTWTLGQHSMTWGGSYDERDQWGVVCVTPIPEPVSAAILAAGLFFISKKKKH